MAGVDEDCFIITPAIYKFQFYVYLTYKLRVMKEEPTLVDALFERVNELGVTWIELMKLRAADKASDAVSSVVPPLIIILLAFGFILFINISLALLLGDLLGRVYIGFLLVACFYLILGVVLHFFLRRRIKKATADYLIRQFFRQ
jgi:hypothetical protein